MNEQSNIVIIADARAHPVQPHNQELFAAWGISARSIARALQFYADELNAIQDRRAAERGQGVNHDTI